MRRTILALITLGIVAAALPVATMAQERRETARQELAEHPRLEAAIRELDDAILYLQAAPHDFGGHKAKAIAASRAAIEELRLAAAYRARVENRR